jgi:hypothetical protein
MQRKRKGYLKEEPKTGEEKWQELKVIRNLIASIPVTLEEDEGKMGRPSVVTTLSLSKLEYAFALGCTDEEACAFAGISEGALHRFQNKFPNYRKRKEALKYLLARESVLGSFMFKPELALRWLENKLPEEFNSKVYHQIEGSIQVSFSEELKKRAQAYANPVITEQETDASPDVRRVEDATG